MAARAGTPVGLALVSRGSVTEVPAKMLPVAAVVASMASAFAVTVAPGTGPWLPSGSSTRWGAPETIDQAAIPEKPE